MSTATEPEVTTDETQAADQLAGRIKDLLPEWEGDGETVLEWTPEGREDVAKLIAEPPDKLGMWGDEVDVSLTFAVATELYVAVIRRKLDNALRRDDRVRKAEKRLAREKATLRTIDDELEDLKKQRKGQESKVEAAVFALQSAVTDQGRRQNTLPLPDGESPEENGASDIPENIPADPAATAPISQLNVPPSIATKLEEAGFRFVGDVISWTNREPRDRPKVKGLGPEKVAAIGDALNQWRAANPMPEVN